MNGVLVHGLDFDDTHMQGVMHVSASCFPCALGVAALTGASGGEFLAAYILGIEVAARLGEAAQGRLHEAGFHPTGTLAAFSSALIAGRLLGLTHEQLVMAQGIALSLTPGSSRQASVEGAWNKRLHPGTGAAAGITAATLARHGYIGPRETYEGRYGFYATHLGPLLAQCDLSLTTVGLGEQWRTLEVAVKPIPACHLLHACSDAAVTIKRKYDIKTTDIASIRARVPQDAIRVICEPVEKRRRPVNSYAAQFSLQYAVACSLARGKFGFREFEADVLNDREIRALADKVEFESDANSAYPRYFDGEVIVTMTDGRVYAHREAINRGAAERPLTSADIVEKFIDNASCVMSAARAENIRDRVLSIELSTHAAELEAALAG
jgi:2-methylcitrate dehydratase PrpD